MQKIVLHERTEKKIAALLGDLPHAVLLSGTKGIGLTTVAKHIAGSNLVALVEPVNSKEEIDADTGTISVVSIRGLYEKTRAKTASRQVIIIDNAHRMSLGAQAAFLKLLEEPTEHTHFILTSHAPQILLPTIRSRVQTTHIDQITDTQTASLLDSLGVTDTKKRSQLTYLASGLPAELVRLARDESYFKERADSMADTRDLLSGTVYERLLVVHKYHQNRSGALRLIDSSLLVIQRGLYTNASNESVNKLEALLEIRDRIEANCSIRLQLMSFVVQ